MSVTSLDLKLWEEKGSTYSEKIREIVTETDGKAGALIQVLQKTQNIIGYLPSPALEEISRSLHIPASEVYGVVSFYNFFSTVPKGKYVIQVCTGTSCYVKGGQRILEVLKRDWGLLPQSITEDGIYSLETVRCLGTCGLSPVISVNGEVHGRVRTSQLKEILSAYQ